MLFANSDFVHWHGSCPHRLFLSVKQHNNIYNYLDLGASTCCNPITRPSSPLLLSLRISSHYAHHHIKPPLAFPLVIFPSISLFTFHHTRLLIISFISLFSPPILLSRSLSTAARHSRHPTYRFVSPTHFLIRLYSLVLPLVRF